MSESTGFCVKEFPPGPHGVLLPTRDRRAAALGICLYTASKPAALRIQRAAHVAVQVAGTRVLPGRQRTWTPPLPAAEWAQLHADWRHALGEFDGVAVYRRRQATRAGLTVLLTAGGRPVAVVKVREDGASLQHEQQALAAVLTHGPRRFRVPEPLGAVSVRPGLHWSAQSAVFDAPHRPVLTAPADLFDEVAEGLAAVVPAAAGQRAAHNDLTPWNLRRDRHGTVWLFDWEDCATAPHEADRAYFCATAAALGAGAVPADLPAAARTYWRERVTARGADNAADAALRDRMLAALESG